MALYRRGKIWWYEFRFQGRKIQESSHFTNKTKAIQVQAKRRSDLLDRGAGFKPSKLAPKFEEYVEQFLEWSKQHHKPKTNALHAWNCQTLKRFFGGKYLDEISTSMVEDFRSSRRVEPRQQAKDGRTVTGATVNRALTTLKLLFYRAERDEYNVKNPVVGVSMFDEPIDSAMRVITFDEQAAYLSNASQPLRDIAKLMLETGMRPEEVFRIRVANIDFKQKTIFNPFGKTKAARRHIPMTDEVLFLLNCRASDATKLGSPFVFPSPYDIQKPVGSVKKAHRAAADRSGIKGHFRLYDLRHTFATRAAASGVDLPTLGALLGHKTIQMTTRYVHPAAEQKRIAMERYEKFRAEGVINAAISQKAGPLPTEVTTVERVN
jgi:integrase